METRGRRSQSPPPSPAIEEKKPMLLDASGNVARFKFSFQEEPMTAVECSLKMNSFNTKEEFLATVAVEEIPLFLTKAIQGQPGEPLKCLTCDKMYASSGGFWKHFRRCNLETEEEIAAAAQEYRDSPYLWLEIPKREQEKMVLSIVGDQLNCFNSPCKKTFKTTQGLIKHLDSCIQPAYFSFFSRPEEFRKLDSKTKGKFARIAMKDTGALKCLVPDCDQEYTTPYALVYHVDRCGVEKADQPWKCYRCGYEGTGAESEKHLVECAKRVETRISEPKVDSLLLTLHNHNDTTEPSTSSSSSTSTKRRRVAGGAPRITARKDGSTLLRFRKSTVNREFNGVVSREDQRCYEESCSDVFANWKIESELIPFCDRLDRIAPSVWQPRALDKKDQFYRLFTRKSVTIRTEKAEGLQSTVPSGIRVDSRKSVVLDVPNNPDTKQATVAFCGAPINGIRVAPRKTVDGDDVICVTTFANETDLESSSSCVQFWKHRVRGEKSEMKLWFLLHIPDHGTILSMTWLQKHDTSEPERIGFVAFATSTGKVLIYRIDSTSAPEEPGSPEDVQVIQADPHLILRLPKQPEETSEEAFLNVTVKIEGDELIIPMKIDESTIPLLKIAWSAENGGSILAATTAIGSIVIWDLQEDLENPRVYIGQDWQSPPSGIAFMDKEHLVVGFREKLVKVMSIYTWEVKLEENTLKTAGTKVHTDPRIVPSFFTYQSEYVAFPFSNATGIAYVHMDMETMNLILIPTGNTHQLMCWDAAMCPPLGTLVSCGIDGRLLASASGRLLRSIHHLFFANRSIMSLKRRRVLREVQTMDEFLRQPKIEDEQQPIATSSSSEEKKAELEESLIEHGDVCQKMWLEASFDQVFEPTRVEMSCKDQRIESLNCVDVTTNAEWPVAFTGGEAGLLFAVSSRLVVKDVKF
uniref:C2H2-type domain-containing protein n=1 Tax=Caenorhabditis tropicalis TaxID=1561998 RepID=A0A1I7USX0_9PELO